MAPKTFGLWALYSNIMKKYIAFFLLAWATAWQAKAQDHFLGNWATDDGKLMIEIYAQDSTYYAKIKSNDNAEANNQLVLIQMVRKSDTQLYGGTYYDVDEKSEYEAKLKLTGSNTMRLKVLSGVFSKTIFWRRVTRNWEQKSNPVTLIH